MSSVFVFPGFLASDLGILSTGQQIWFKPAVALSLGTGGLRLASDGFSPGPPDGQALGVQSVPQDPWTDVIRFLDNQLADTPYVVRFSAFDWRFDLRTQATQLATGIAATIPPTDPCTLVGHSAGGMICCLAYGQLVAAGKANLVRRVITLGSPFQGAYAPIQWLLGSNPSVQQLIALGLTSGLFPPLNLQFQLNFLNALALTWPAFYELYPSLIGTEQENDPQRSRLYDLANYGAPTAPSPVWLDFVKTTFQPVMADARTIPPAWVLTTVAGTGLQTVNRLTSGRVPLALNELGTTFDGDGIVTVGSAHRGVGFEVDIVSNHASIPLGVAASGLLAQLILDTRGPPDPPPPPLKVGIPVGQNVTDPPESDYVSGLTCIGGG